MKEAEKSCQKRKEKYGNMFRSALANQKLTDCLSRNLEKITEMDFGHDEAFHELHGKCFDLDTNE